MKNVIVATLLGLASRATAQIATVCANTDVCYGLNIPSNTASSGSGDIFFQISAPSTYQWVALGQGSGMTNANIFVVYVSASGNNVTLSPRKGTGHVEPTYSNSAQVSLLDGSGVSNGKMIANVKCSNCQSWSGGSMDFSSSSGNWIHAFQSSGGPLKSDDTSASISQHGQSDAAAFSWSFANAKGGNSVNPFTTSVASGSSSGATVVATSGTSSCVPRPTTGTFAAAASTTTWPSTIPSNFANHFPTEFPSEWRSNWPTARPTDGGGYYSRFPRANPSSWPGSPWLERDTINYCDSSENSPSNTIVPLQSTSNKRITMMLIAHGTLAALAFVVFFPAGAIAMRLGNFPGLIWFHAAFQIFAYVVFIAAFGLGVYIANTEGLLSNYHPVIGIVLFVVIFFQPIFGFLHHNLFKQYNGRTFWSYIHIWLGRIIITLGIINGGLGFMLANTLGNGSHSGMIAYAVIAAIVWLIYVLATVLGEGRRRMRRDADAPPKYSESPVETPLESLNPSPERGARDAGVHGYYGRRKANP